jgi:hypothetical protein
MQAAEIELAGALHRPINFIASEFNSDRLLAHRMFMCQGFSRVYVCQSSRKRIKLVDPDAWKASEQREQKESLKRLRETQSLSTYMSGRESR